MTKEGERVIEMVNELGSRFGHALTDMVPPSAQVHLLNAQRELITALMLIYEHRVSAMPPEAARAKRAGERSPRRPATRRRGPRRIGKIPIE